MRMQLFSCASNLKNKLAYSTINILGIPKKLENRLRNWFMSLFIIIYIIYIIIIKNVGKCGHFSVIIPVRS